MRIRIATSGSQLPLEVAADWTYIRWHGPTQFNHGASVATGRVGRAERAYAEGAGLEAAQAGGVITT